jgi:hypothetical protein
VSSDLCYALKCYPISEERPDRLLREFTACVFLAEQPESDFTVPRAVAADYQRRLGLYSWLDGARPGAATPQDILEMAAFIRRLRSLSSVQGANVIGQAAEATLSGLETIRQIEGRLSALAPARAGSAELAMLLSGPFEALWSRSLEAMAASYRAAHLDIERSLEPERRVLSPSDFGLHNSLRLKDGRLAFLDFEYFGWDDPVRLIVDVICHPAMMLDESQRRLFLECCLPEFSGDASFAVRLSALAPLVALRWVLILLNEFLPIHWYRRVQAGAAGDWSAAKRRQLEKAFRMLDFCEALLTAFGT